MTRTILLILLSLLILLAATAVFSAVLAAYSPLQPGNPLFSAQELAESARADLTSTPSERMDYALTVLERRTHDLARVVGQPAESAALHALDTALNRVMLALAALSPQQRLVSGKHTADDLAAIVETLERMRRVERVWLSEMESLAAKVAALDSLVKGGAAKPETLQQLSSWKIASPAPAGDFTLAMLRQGESGGFTHAVFPLSQHHSTLTCRQCHTTDQVKESVACQTCHANEKPANHYEADCNACHFTSAWKPSRMNHGEVGADCASCHLEQRPADHFKEQCSMCHAAPSFSGGLNAGLTAGFLPLGEAWHIIHFNHAVAGVTDCQACHLKSRPGEHYNGQCSQCHATTHFSPSSFAHTTEKACATCHAQRKPATHYVGECQACHAAPAAGAALVTWKGANFTHPSETDCSGCHLTFRPAVHYVGQCSDCHAPPTPGSVFVGWKGAQYTHSDASSLCAACHLGDAPSNHYSAPCSACHSMPVAGTASNGWRGAVFNHAAVGATNCIGCHAGDKLVNHYPGQCSSCHTSTSSWRPVSFNHTVAGVIDCLSCHLNRAPAGHYVAQCSLCHATSGWYPVRFDHVTAKATDCISCHASRKPAGHYTAQCSSCHSTSAWKPVNFNHALVNATDCLGCHTGDKPANHYTAQCSSCHSTSAWKPVNFNHAVAGATDCLGCHLGSKPASHVSTQCSACHTTTGWVPATFTHSFPLNHGKADAKCTVCHPTSVPAYTCYSCHNELDLRKKHAGITPIPADCMQCHPDGKEPDDD